MSVMLLSIASFAQTKGEMFIAGTVSADLGTQKTTLSDDRTLHLLNSR